MPRTDFYIKVQMEHDARDTPEKLGNELCRQLFKVYGVEVAEVSNFVTHEERA